MEINGYTIRETWRGGKAGRGRNATASIQVLRDSLLIKTFRFTVGDEASKSAAFAGAYLFGTTTKGLIRAERKTLADVVRDHILSTYLRHDGDKTATAAELGVCLKTLYNHLRRYGVIKFSPKTTIKNTECV